MSAAATQSSAVTSVFHNFVFKWTLKAKQLNDLKEKPGVSVVPSDIHHFKLFHDLRFYLEAVYDVSKNPCYFISIKGSKSWSFKAVNPFLVSKERAIRLIDSPQMSFLPTYYMSSVPDEEDVTIHCVVSARPAHPTSSADEDELLPTKGQNTVYIESTSDVTFPSNYNNDIVTDFVLNGVIPNLTVDEAIKIIKETSEHKSEALEILCAEYMRKNITQENIKQISRVSLDHGLICLERCCLELIINGTYQIT